MEKEKNFLKSPVKSPEAQGRMADNMSNKEKSLFSRIGKNKTVRGIAALILGVTYYAKADSFSFGTGDAHAKSLPVSAESSRLINSVSPDPSMKNVESFADQEKRLIAERHAVSDALTDKIDSLLNGKINISFENSENGQLYEKLFRVYGSNEINQDNVNSLIYNALEGYYVYTEFLYETQTNNSNCQEGSKHRVENTVRNNNKLVQLAGETQASLESLLIDGGISVDDASSASLFAKYLTVKFFDELNGKSTDWVINKLNKDGLLRVKKDNDAAEFLRYALRDLPGEFEKVLSESVGNVGLDELESRLNQVIKAKLKYIEENVEEKSVLKILGNIDKEDFYVDLSEIESGDKVEDVQDELTQEEESSQTDEDRIEENEKAEQQVKSEKVENNSEKTELIDRIKDLVKKQQVRIIQICTYYNSKHKAGEFQDLDPNNFDIRVAMGDGKIYVYSEKNADKDNGESVEDVSAENVLDRFIVKNGESPVIDDIRVGSMVGSVDFEIDEDVLREAYGKY